MGKLKVAHPRPLSNLHRLDRLHAFRRRYVRLSLGLSGFLHRLEAWTLDEAEVKRTVSALEDEAETMERELGEITDGMNGQPEGRG